MDEDGQKAETLLIRRINSGDVMYSIVTTVNDTVLYT